MRLDTTFRVSFYLTLALACACLAQAEAFFQGWVAWASLPLAIVVFVLAWRHEGQWIIHETASNYLGIFILFATVGWTLMQVPRSDADIAAGAIPWPAGLLPHLGLLLLMLLAVKLFRPKALSDFWVIQTMGLMVVTLGCVLAGDPLFAGLMLAYLASLLWCLALFQLYRARRPADGPLFTPADALWVASPMPWRCLGLDRSLRWSSAVMLIGMPLFLMMPRSTNSQWVPQKLTSSAAATMTVGVETGINLHRIGTVELSPNPAFHVTITDASGKPVRLEGDQLWRVDVLDYYNKGRWMTWGQAQEFLRAPAPPRLGSMLASPGMMPPAQSATGDTQQPQPRAGTAVLGKTALGGARSQLPIPVIPMPGMARDPDDGPTQALPMMPVPRPPAGTQPITPITPPANLRQRFLSYVVRPHDAGGLVLAEPLDVRHVGLRARIGDELPATGELFQAVSGADSVMAFLPQRRQIYTYGQVIEPVPGAQRLPGLSVDTKYRDYLVAPAVPGEVAEWARLRVLELPQLTPAQRSLDDAGHVLDEHHAAVSLALCRYLALSGEYTYTLNLMRQSRTLDPTADFLLNVKAGHCERFAAGLALSLRGLGIPARIVKGYRGAEEEEQGKYVVRLDQAHSWVQVLVRGDDGWDWLTLDPTPGQGETRNPLTNWLAWMSELEPELLWRRFVLNYNGDVQLNTLHYIGQGIWQSPTGRNLLWQAPLGGAAVLMLVMAWRRRARLGRLVKLPRLGRSPAVPGFYGEMLRLLSRRLDLRPRVGQTPLEFAVAAGTALGQCPATVAWSPLPAAATRALYRMRFAGQALTADEEKTFRHQLAALAAALATRPKPGGDVLPGGATATA
jgi:hypothetical protein